MAINNNETGKVSIDPEIISNEMQTDEKLPSFFVAGIGASAGGIEAIIDLLKHLPSNLGMAYVIVQHLSPYHESVLPEVLQNKTVLKVHLVEDGIQIEPDNVYVIPPNNYMSIVDGHLALSARPLKTNIVHPIDYFLSTLASVYQNKGVGIILSGTATDGTVGIQAIKAEGGITFAQDDSATFRGMPSSAANSGFVDFILSPEAIAKELVAFVNLPYTGLSAAKILENTESELRKIFHIILQKHDIDFLQYKQTTIKRRILRRMILNRLKDLDEYISLLREKSAEVDLLYNDLLINVTSFFRDPQLYQALGKKVLPDLFKNKKSSEPLRIWIPACSTGEEAYSFGICLFEYLGDKALSTPIQIFATDLSEKSIDKARTGIYHKSTLQNISPLRLRRFFIKIDGSFQIIKPIRDACVFAVHNLLSDPPFSRMDIISCQNVMIYLEPNAQKKILQSFYYALKSTGFLLLGKSESLGKASELFDQADKQYKIYSKKPDIPALPFEFKVHRPAVALYDTAGGEERFPEREAEIDFEKETDRLLLSRFVPASVVINKDLQIMRFQGNVANFLQPASGKASLNLLKMLRGDLVFEVRNLLHRVKKEGYPIKKEGIPLADTNRITEISIEILPVRPASKEPYYLILFKEALLPAASVPKVSAKLTKDAKDKRIQALEQEVQGAREHIKSMTEEFEATREELQSANEEVLSSNEELQSINEELETSKEEMQSTNEELTTINEELQLRLTDLRETVNYAETIVETIREPLLLLNGDMRVRTANKAFYDLFKLKPENTEGSYFFEINNGLWDIKQLRLQLAEITNKNKSFQNFELTHNFPEIGEKILVFNASSLLQQDDKKSKYLLAIEDVTERRKAENELKESLYLNTTILNSINDIFISVDNNWNFIFVNQQGEKFIEAKASDILGKSIWSAMFKYKDTLLQNNLQEAMQAKIFYEFEFLDKPSHQWYQCRIYPSPEGLSLYATNITQRKQLEAHQKESEETYRLLVQNGFDIICIFAKDGIIKYMSDSIKEVLGYESEERAGKNVFHDPIVFSEDIHLAEKMFSDSLDNPNKIIKGEFRIMHKDGSIKTMEYVCRNLLSVANVNGIVANFRDVTERRMLEKQKEEFIAIASHELKTPVTSIKAYSEILNEIFEDAGDPQSAAMVNKLGAQIDRLTVLVKELLDVSTITEGQLKIFENEFEMKEVIEETVEDMQRITPNHQLITRLQPAKKIMGDKNRIEQVLVNLISNAIKYSPKANKVIISLASDAKGLTVTVEDFGIGMTPDAQQKVFDRFYRASSPGLKTFPGLGLGLYISSEIIKKQGGTLTVISRENQGSVFKFNLPYKN